MQSITALVALTCLGLCAASNTGSPVEKVVILLKDMQAKIKADGATEKALYEKYSCWCTGMTGKKGAAIEQAKTDLKSLGADIMSLRGKIAKFSSEINDAAKDMQDNHKAQQKATKARDLENAAFTALRAEMGQCLQSLNQALKMLKMAPQFLQTSSHQGLSMEAADAVRTAIDSIPDKALGSMPAAKLSQLQLIGSAVANGKYNPSYGSIVSILEAMQSQFTDDLDKETSTENKSKKDFADLMDGKVKEIETLSEKVDKREASKAEAASDLADTTQNYDDTDSQMNADIKFFTEAVTNCEKKAKDWEKRTELRVEELDGITKALEILTSDEARALFAGAINAGARVGFLQVAMSPNNKMLDGQEKAFKVVKEFAATSSQSMALARIAAKIRLAQGGHFDDVMGAIDKVIKVLKDEQDSDNAKKTQCNDEYQNVAQESGDLEWKIEKNEAKIDKLESIIAQKQEEKAETIQAIKDTKQEIKDMVKQRDTEEKAYDAAKKDDQDAVVLLNKAKDALMAYAKKHSTGGDKIGAFLLQEPEFDRGSAGPDAKFSGKGSRGQQTKGIGMLLQSIIEGLEEEIRVQDKVEKESIASFNTAKKAAEDLQKKLETKETNLKKEIADRNKDKDDENDKKKDNEKDLKSEVDYKAKIKPDCDFMLENWQDRYTKRKGEMNGLVEAKDFLAGAMGGSALVETKKHF